MPCRPGCNRFGTLKPKGSVDLVGAEVNYTSADNTAGEDQVRPVGESVSIQPAISLTDWKRCKGDYVTISVAISRICAPFPIERHFRQRFCEHADGAFHLHFENIAADHVGWIRDRDMMIALPAKLRKPCAT